LRLQPSGLETIRKSVPSSLAQAWITPVVGADWA
jgi:hypothetical protein